LEVQRAPPLHGSAIGEVLAQRVGVVEAARLEDVEGRVHVGQPLLVGGNVHGALPHAHGGGGRRRRRREGGEQERRGEDGHGWFLSTRAADSSSRNSVAWGWRLRIEA